MKQLEDFMINRMENFMLERIYPIGSMYFSIDGSTPKTLFDFGEWEQIQDRFLVAAGNEYENGSMGGEAEHLLTIDEMPNHKHQLGFTSDNDGNWSLNKPNSIIYATSTASIKGQGPQGVSRSYGVNGTFGDRGVKTYEDSTIIDFTGGSLAHNNLPPYLAVYIFKRIA